VQLLMDGAIFSPDRRYRYTLTRTITLGNKSLLWIMLNPSTADESIDDPTIRRCIGFTREFGYAGFTVVNLYAYRATKPADLWKAVKPIGEKNDQVIMRYARKADRVICAWGMHAPASRVDQVCALLRHVRFRGEAYCLGFTANGNPRHPLMLRADTKMMGYVGR
jgi:hypothetical protein